MQDLGFCTFEYNKSNDIYILQLKENHTINLIEAKKLVQLLKEYASPENKIKVLVKIKNVRPSAEVCNYFEKAQASKLIKKAAFVSSSQSNLLLLSLVFYLISNRYEHEAFLDEKKAIEWLIKEKPINKNENIENVFFNKSNFSSDLVNTFKKGTLINILIISGISIYQFLFSNILLGLYCLAISLVMFVLNKNINVKRLELVLNTYIGAILFFSGFLVLGTQGYRSPYITLLVLAPIVVTTLSPPKNIKFWIFFAPASLATLSLIGAMLKTFPMFAGLDTPHIGAVLLPLGIAFTNSFRLLKTRAALDEQYKQTRNSQMFLKNVFAGITDMIFLVDNHWKIAFVNDETSEKLGYAKKELVGKSFSEMFLSPFIQYESINKISQIKAFETETVIQGKGSNQIPVIIKISGTNIRHNDQIYWIIIAIDISERKRQELYLINNERFSLMGQMAGGIAHEINNPLTVITLKADQVLKSISKQPPDVEKAKAHITHIDNTIERITKVITGLRKLSRDAGIDPLTSYSAQTLIEEALLISSEKLKNTDIKIKTDFPQYIEFECRPVQIEQVLLNLINNSIDALEDQKSNKWIKLSFEEKNNFVNFRCADSGTQLTADLKEKIFDPFYTTKQPGKGSGIGLMISRKIAQAHNGSLILETTQPNTCFLLSLPKKHFSHSIN